MNKGRLWTISACLLLFTGRAGSQSSSNSTSPPPAGKSHFASFGTNKVHYVTVGTGRQTVVFVHGWAGNNGLWREQVPALADKARLILIDLPGHGQSDKPRREYTMDFFARGVLAVIRDARVDKATFIGHSMGVPVICRVYAQAPEKVAALAAVDGILRRPSISPEQTEQFVGPFRRPDYREHTTRFIGSMFPNPGTEALRERVLAEMLATPQHVMLGAMEGMFGAGQPAWDLSKVRVPVLVINAKNPMWTAEYETYVRSLSPQTDYRIIEGVGHFLMLEKPAEFNAALTDMLRKFDLVSK
jgi:pimeloyl-ACP methyl ester carboxylesterase